MTQQEIDEIALSVFGTMATHQETQFARALLAKAVPEGFVVVPKEPTFEMLRPHHECGGKTGATLMANSYRAMIAAAPSPEGEKK